MRKNTQEIIEDLQKLVGKDHVITDSHILQRQSVDYVGYRNVERYRSRFLAIIPTCIVKPMNVQEVSIVLQYLNDNKINCVPKTGASGSTAGAEAGDAVTVIVDGSSMNKIVLFDETNMQVTLQCGTPLEYLEQYANQRGLTTGHFPQSLPMAQMGGLTATRSIGQFSTLYGGIEDLVVGLEAVMPNGRIVKIKNVPRRSAGPDLRHVFVGSEGTLGYITEVTVKLFPYNPAGRWMQAYAVNNMDVGLAFLREIMAQGYKPAVARLHDQWEASGSYSKFIRNGESIILLIADGPTAVNQATGKAIHQISKKIGARALGAQPLRLWLEHRNKLCEELDDSSNLRSGILWDTCEIAANWSDINKIYHTVIERLPKEIDSLVSITGHASHVYMQGTNIYFIYSFKTVDDDDANRDTYFKILGIIMEETLKYNGTIAHHHGIGKYKVKWSEAEHGSSYCMLETLKKAFDPNNIMNRGTLIP